MKTKPVKRGRPKSESPRNIVWPTRLSREEANQIDAKAKKSGKVRGEWIRQTLLAA